MEYAKVIVNPVAGAGRTRRKWPEIMSGLKSLGVRFDHALTEARGHATLLAREAVLDGYGLVISVGGDGTASEVANGIYGTEGNTLLGIINTGTGSDYIRTIGVPRLPEEACRRLLDPEVISVDLGEVSYVNNGKAKKRLFVNFAGVGLDAGIVRATTRRFKSFGSKPAYLAGLLSTLLCYRNENVAMRLDDETDEKTVCEVLVSNGRYGGGGMLVAPQADPQDGLLDVMRVEGLSRPELLRYLPMVYKGTHINHPKVSIRQAREIEISPTRPMPLQADGELLGETPVKIRILPMALRVAV